MVQTYDDTIHMQYLYPFTSFFVWISGNGCILTIPSQASLLYWDVSVLVAGRDLVAGQEHRRASLQVSLEMGYGINFMVINPGETDDTNQINHGIPLPLSPKKWTKPNEGSDL